MKNIIDIMNWRYATKKFDASKRLSKETLNTILEATNLTPTSYGLQAYKMIVIPQESELREKLKASAWNQSQLTDASEIVVFAIPKEISEKDADEYMNLISKVRGVPVENLKGYRDMIVGTMNQYSMEDRRIWLARQVYIALGFMISSSSMLEVDSCPMEGFDNASFDQILGLGEKGLTSVVVCALGYRDANDDYAKNKKVGKDLSDVVIEIK